MYVECSRFEFTLILSFLDFQEHQVICFCIYNQKYCSIMSDEVFEAKLLFAGFAIGSVDGRVAFEMSSSSESDNIRSISDYYQLKL